MLKVTFEIYKGQNLKLLNIKSYDLPITYKYNSKFQFLNNVSTSSTDSINKIVKDHLFKVTNKFVKEINCLPLEGN